MSLVEQERHSIRVACSMKSTRLTEEVPTAYVSHVNHLKGPALRDLDVIPGLSYGCRSGKIILC